MVKLKMQRYIIFQNQGSVFCLYEQIVQHDLFLNDATMFAVGNAVRCYHRQMNGLFGCKRILKRFDTYL